MKRLSISVIASVFVVVFQNSVAFAACSGDGLSDCKESVSDARRKAAETSNPLTKAEAAGEAVGNCIKCGAEALATSMRDFGRNLTGSDKRR
jgi:hypothetical protein